MQATVSDMPFHNRHELDAATDLIASDVLRSFWVSQLDGMSKSHLSAMNNIEYKVCIAGYASHHPMHVMQVCAFELFTHKVCAFLALTVVVVVAATVHVVDVQPGVPVLHPVESLLLVPTQ